MIQSSQIENNDTSERISEIANKGEVMAVETPGMLTTDVTTRMASSAMPTIHEFPDPPA